MNKNLMPFSIIFLGLCIVLGSWFISQSLKDNRNQKVVVTPSNNFRYKLISPNQSNIILFDKQSRELWRRYIEPSEGPTNWEKQQSPVTPTTK